MDLRAGIVFVVGWPVAATAVPAIPFARAVTRRIVPAAEGNA